MRIRKIKACFHLGLQFIGQVRGVSDFDIILVLEVEDVLLEFETLFECKRSI